MKWLRWSDQEKQIIRDHHLEGSQSVVNQIKKQTGRCRTRSTVRDMAAKLGCNIRRPTKGWVDHAGKLRMRIPGERHATFSPDRKGLSDDEVLLQDGSVIKRSEMARLNRTMYYYYQCPSNSLKGLMRNIARLEQKTYEVNRE